MTLTEKMVEHKTSFNSERFVADILINLLALLESKPFQCQKLLLVESSQSVTNETAAFEKFFNFICKLWFLLLCVVKKLSV